MTFAKVSKALADLGIVIGRGGTNDDYRVNFRDGKEATAYYTDDLDDAFATGQRMYEERLSKVNDRYSGYKINTSNARMEVAAFHDRLKDNVAKITCDVPKNEEELRQLMYKMSLAGKYDLIKVFWGELQQVIQAVSEAK